MPQLPVLSGAETVKVLQRLGFSPVRQKGSHVVLRRNDRGCVVPMHKELAVGTLRGALKQAGISTDDFLTAYQQ